MKRSTLLVIAILVLIATGITFGPRLALMAAKRNVLRTISPEAKQALGIIPTKCIRIPPRQWAANTPRLTITVEPLEISLPADEFSRAQDEQIVVLASDKVKVLFRECTTKPMEELLKNGGLGSTAFDIVHNAFHTSVEDLEASRSLAALRKYAPLIFLKMMLSPLRADKGFEEFECGNLRGFISGHLGKDQPVMVQLFPNGMNGWLNMLIVGTGAQAKYSDVYDVISKMKLRLIPTTQKTADSSTTQPATASSPAVIPLQ